MTIKTTATKVATAQFGTVAGIDACARMLQSALSDARPVVLNLQMHVGAFNNRRPLPSLPEDFLVIPIDSVSKYAALRPIILNEVQRTGLEPQIFIAHSDQIFSVNSFERASNWRRLPGLYSDHIASTATDSSRDVKHNESYATLLQPSLVTGRPSKLSAEYYGRKGKFAIEGARYDGFSKILTVVRIWDEQLRDSLAPTIHARLPIHLIAKSSVNLNELEKIEEQAEQWQSGKAAADEILWRHMYYDIKSSDQIMPAGDIVFQPLPRVFKRSDNASHGIVNPEPIRSGLV